MQYKDNQIFSLSISWGKCWQCFILRKVVWFDYLIRKTELENTDNECLKSRKYFQYSSSFFMNMVLSPNEWPPTFCVVRIYYALEFSSNFLIFMRIIMIIKFYDMIDLVSSIYSKNGSSDIVAARIMTPKFIN